MGVVGVMGIAGAGIAAAQEYQQKRLIQVGEVQKWIPFEDIRKLAIKSHQEGRCGGFMDVTRFASTYKAQGKLVAHFPKNKMPRHENEVLPYLEKLSSSELLGQTEVLSTKFKNRYYTSDYGVNSMQYLFEQFKKYGAHRSDIEVKMFKHKDFKQPSVIAAIQGQGATKDEFVVIGGHGDSVNWSMGMPHPDGLAPGADDNASGTSTVLEVFRVLAQGDFRPKRTLLFMIYAGEELGLLGSQEIAQYFRHGDEKVIGVMQFDMTAYPGDGSFIHFIMDNTNSELTKFSTMLADKYVKQPWKMHNCGYACSDHASWDRAGYAATFPFEAGDHDNPKIHTKNDTIQNGLDFKFGLQFAQLGTAFAIEMGLK